jgi:hypothetical protein
MPQFNLFALLPRTTAYEASERSAAARPPCCQSYPTGKDYQGIQPISANAFLTQKSTRPIPSPLSAFFWPQVCQPALFSDHLGSGRLVAFPGGTLTWAYPRYFGFLSFRFGLPLVRTEYLFVRNGIMVTCTEEHVSRASFYSLLV